MMTPSLFHLILGESFDSLPEPIGTLHDGHDKTWVGRCDVERGNGLLSRLLAFVASLPPPGKDQVIELTIVRRDQSEIWTRQFGRRSMRSVLSVRDIALVERLGSVRFKFNPVYDSDGQCMHWHLLGVSVLGVPLPVSWFDKVAACESVNDGRYCFDVTATLPVAGLLVRYKGWLDVRQVTR